MTKRRRARVLDDAEWDAVFKNIKENRHSIRNTAIMMLSKVLGLTPLELVNLKIGNLAVIDEDNKTSKRNFQLRQEISIIVENAARERASSAKAEKYLQTKKSVTLSVSEFKMVIAQIESDVQRGEKVDYRNYFPRKRQRTKADRNLPLVNIPLRKALEEHLTLRLAETQYLTNDDYLFLTQKKVQFSPHTIQKTMSKMFNKWCGLHGATGTSGRIGLADNMLNEQKLPLSVAQAILGHDSKRHTAIYKD